MVHRPVRRSAGIRPEAVLNRCWHIFFIGTMSCELEKKMQPTAPACLEFPKRRSPGERKTPGVQLLQINSGQAFGSFFAVKMEYLWPLAKLPLAMDYVRARL